MIVVYCNRCYTGVRVMGDPIEVATIVGEGSDFWPDKYTCIACDGRASCALEVDIEPNVIRMLKMRDLTAQEMVSALHGLGTPDEMVCDLSTVRELFSTKAVKEVRGSTVKGTQRAVIDHFIFEDGTRLFVGSGSHGAVVYRIARPFSYVENNNG